MAEFNEQILGLLRSPNDLQPLQLRDDQAFQSASGANYPILNGVICLLPENERGVDLGDGRFYEENPFGLRDWSNPEEVEAGVEKELKELLAPLPRETLIADIGCGTGRVSNYLSLKGFCNVLSLDYSLASIRMVKKVSRNVCTWGNNLSLPIADNAFDLVISTGVIHHTPDPARALAECARVVKPGGLFYLKLRNIHSPYGYLFYTYGSVLRFFEKHNSLHFLSEVFGFGMYKLARRVFYSQLPKREDKQLRGKYENLFIKKMITFFSTNQVKRLLRENQLEIQYGRKVGSTHRQHFYVLKKQSKKIN